MSRRALDALSLLSASILVLTGQGFLLTPHLMKGPALAWPEQIVVAGGLLLFLAGTFSAATVIFELHKTKSKLAIALTALCMAALGAYYAMSGCMLEPLIMVGTALALIFNTFLRQNDAPFWKNFFTLFGALTNLVGASLFFLAERLSLSELTGTAAWRWPLTGLFLAGAATGALGLFLPDGRWKQGYSKLTAVPWVAWALYATLVSHPMNVIPAASFATILVAIDTIPWAHLKLPSEDILGHRFVLLATVMQSVLLIGFVFLLKTLDGIRPAESAMGFLTFESGSELILLLNLGVEVIIGYALISLTASIHELMRRSASEPRLSHEADEAHRTWSERIERLTLPFAGPKLDIQKQLDLQIQRSIASGKQLEKEKRRTAQLTLLSEFSQQLETQLDVPVAGQMAVNTLQRSLGCSFVALYLNDAERRELVALAAAGTRSNILPPGFRQPIGTGVLGRTARLRKTQMVNDLQRDPDYLRLEQDDSQSVVVVPLIDHGHLKGVLEMCESRTNAFSGHDVQIAEAVAAELLRAWERSEYHQRLTELIQAGISLTTQPDPQAAVQEVAGIARQTLRARFAFVTLLDQEGNFTRSAFAGNAPRLLKSLNRNTANDPLMRAALNADRPFRLRDLRKYKQASHIELDHPGLRSMIAIPIRVHRLSVGAMLTFGKQGEVFFTENDESLASLLSSQAAAAVESAWLSQELRTNLFTTTQLYNLSFHVIQAEELNEAITYIAESAQKLCGAASAGIALFTLGGKSEAEVQLNEFGAKVTPDHPHDLIRRAMESQQSIFLSAEDDVSRICFPLKTQMRLYGALWLIVPEHRGPRYATNLQTLANQAAVALERSILLVESRAQAKQIEEAYQELELTYDRTLAALMSALDARDRETEGHSTRVAKFARMLGEELRLSPLELKALERGSLLHDIGKIGISDVILHKPGPLNENEWKIMRQHPDIGARIVEDIPFLQDTLDVVRHHQERWDGSGYPLGLSGKDIPLLARIFAVVDAFDALTSKRPYRTQISAAEALAYLRENAGILFDPEIVTALSALASDGRLSEWEGEG